MNRTTKTLLILVTTLVVAVVAGSLLIDRLIKTGIEKGATRALGVETELKQVDLSAFSGQFAMSGLRVNNPKEFTDAYFLKLDDCEIHLSLSTLMSNQVILPKIALSGIELLLEHNGRTGNYDVILENIGGQKDQKQPDTDQEKPSADSDEAQGKQYIVEELTIRNVTVHTQVLPSGGELSQFTVNVPDIHLENVGSDTGNTDLITQISSTVLQAVLTAVAGKSEDMIPKTIVNGLTNALESLDAIGTVVIDEAGNAAVQLGKEIHQAVNEATEQIGEEFGKVLENLDEALPKKDPPEPTP